MTASPQLPLSIGAIHFIGIGGIGMSGIAEVLLNLGHTVQGSDLRGSPITDRLATLGARILIGQRAENIGDAQVVVVSTAIKADNPELAEARARGLPIVRRAEMLAELMRLKWNVAVAGTHGKTTTTSLVAALLVGGGKDPTVINGGIIHAYGSNARMGAGEWMVVEADESDGSFLRLPATMAIVTNIDPEHLDHYGDFDAVRAAFLRFVESIPFYGAALCCIDHPEVQALIGKVRDRRVVSYGFSPQAELRVDNLRYEGATAIFDLDIRPSVKRAARRIADLRLPMPGDHNVLNAAAAVGVALEMGIAEADIRTALAGFGGVKRRFTKVGEWNGAMIIDDYGHHPVEIAAVLRAARKAAQGRVIAVHQPHRYTRLSSLFEEFCGCFNDADVAIIADVYPAGEQPIAGADKDSLVEAMRARGHRRALALSGPESLAATIKAEVRPGDIVMCLGAGNITQWAADLEAGLKAL